MIVRVRHIRCDQQRRSDEYLAPDNKTAEEFQKDVDDAEAAYLFARAEFERITPKPDPWIEWVDQFIDKRNGVNDQMTIGQAKVRKEQLFEEHAEWSKKRDEAAGSFQSHMAARGYQRIIDMVDIPEAEAEWGHRHGERLF